MADLLHLCTVLFLILWRILQLRVALRVADHRLLAVTVGGVTGRSTVLCSFQLHLDRRWAELHAVLEVNELTL